MLCLLDYWRIFVPKYFKFNYIFVLRLHNGVYIEKVLTQSTRNQRHSGFAQLI